MTATKTSALEALVASTASAVKVKVAEMNKRLAGLNPDPKSRPTAGPQHSEKFIAEAFNAAAVREAFIADVKDAL